ncbi:MAG: transcriptional regulator, partial [Burkholderiaceae bacterium]|nr:transcriptional regulator [Burkholderiaceae bacterium]
MASSSSSSKNPIAQGFAGGLAKKSLSPEQMEALFKEVSAFFAVLAEPSRLRIMYALCEGEKSVSEVIEYSKSSQANVSRHLGTLHEAGIL